MAKQIEISETLSCFFGAYTTNPLEFEFKLGEIRLIEEIVKYINEKINYSKQNQTIPNVGLEYFEDLEVVPSKGKFCWRKKLCQTPLGLFFGDPNDGHIAVVCGTDSSKKGPNIEKLTDNLFEKAEKTFTKDTNSNRLREFTKDCVQVIVSDGKKVTGTVRCIFCNLNSLAVNVKIFYQIVSGTGYWILSNLVKHIEKYHSSAHTAKKKDGIGQLKVKQKIKSEGRSFSDIVLNVPEKSTKKKQPCASKDMDDELKSYEDQLYRQMYVQLLEMTNSACSNKENVIRKSIQTDMNEAAAPETIGICETEPDGHCLFAAFALQIYGCNLNSEDHRSKIVELRDQVVQHIGQNFHDSLHCLKGRVYEKKEKSGGSQPSKDVTSESFVSKHLSNNAWGGMETFKAISEIHGVNIVVVNYDGSWNLPNRFDRQNERTLMVFFSDFNNNQSKCPAVNSDKNHSDSIVEAEFSTLTRITAEIIASEAQYLNFKSDIQNAEIVINDSIS